MWEPRTFGTNRASFSAEKAFSTRDTKSRLAEFPHCLQEGHDVIARAKIKIVAG